MGMIIFENDPPYERLEAQSAQAIPRACPAAIGHLHLHSCTPSKHRTKEKFATFVVRGLFVLNFEILRAKARRELSSNPDRDGTTFRPSWGVEHEGSLGKQSSTQSPRRAGEELPILPTPTTVERGLLGVGHL